MKYDEPQPTPSHTPLVVKAISPNRERHPELGPAQTVTLWEGPRARKEACHRTIFNRDTGEFHHDAITLRTLRRKQGDWREDLEHSLTLEGHDPMQRLVDFIVASCSGIVPPSKGEFVVLSAPEGADGASVAKLIESLAETTKAELLVSLLQQMELTPDFLQHLVRRLSADPALVVETAASLNLIRYQEALERLRYLINSNAREQEFQGLLAAHPWMFGSEYSEVNDRRSLTRDEQADFLLRRTTDNYLELIEIKTPLGGKPLLNLDRSHSSYYACSELSQVIGQVQHYLEEIDCTRSDVIRRDGEDPLKLRAKIIIGRDGGKNQSEALRIFNAYLHRIEVMTFDHLLRIAERVVSYLDKLGARTSSDLDEYIPF